MTVSWSSYGYPPSHPARIFVFRSGVLYFGDLGASFGGNSQEGDPALAAAERVSRNEPLLDPGTSELRG